MKKSSYGKLTAGLIVVWFAFALTASALNFFKGNPSLPPIALGLAALIPVLLFLLWMGVSQGFHEFAMSLDPRILTFVQSWRIGGHVFLVLASAGLLPVLFAWPAGWGDMAIGITAPLAAIKLATANRRSSFTRWQILGIVDLVVAVSLGATAQLISPHGIATSIMTELPMSLIPTFAVPLFAMLHIICIAQARQWHTADEPASIQATA
jgi:hypothetical protein